MSLQSLLDGRITTLTQGTAQQLDSVQTTLRENTKHLGDETGSSRKNLGDIVVKTIGEMMQLQKTELAEIRTTIDGRLSAIQTDNEKKLDQMRQTVDEKLEGIRKRVSASPSSRSAIVWSRYTKDSAKCSPWLPASAT